MFIANRHYYTDFPLFVKPISPDFSNIFETAFLARIFAAFLEKSLDYQAPSPLILWLQRRDFP